MQSLQGRFDKVKMADSEAMAQHEVPKLAGGSRTIRQFDHTGSHVGCQSEAMTAGKYQFSDGKVIDSMVWARHRH